MSNPPTTSSSPRGRGRGRSNRGGLGKYLRAQGKRGYAGRPAAFSDRLVLDSERDVELDEEEEKAMRAKYAKRGLGSNADRYEEVKKDGDDETGTGNGEEEEEEEEPEVDLSSFLEKQRLEDKPSTPLKFVSSHSDDEDDVDHSIQIRGQQTRKGKVQQIAWDSDLQDLQQEKKSAEAVRDLKARFKGDAGNTSRYAKGVFLAAPAQGAAPAKGSKQEMQDFLDNLLD